MTRRPCRGYDDRDPLEEVGQAHRAALARAGAADLTPSARWSAAVLIGYLTSYTRHNDGVRAEQLLPLAGQAIRTLRRGLADAAAAGVYRREHVRGSHLPAWYDIRAAAVTATPGLAVSSRPPKNGREDGATRTGSRPLRAGRAHGHSRVAAFTARHGWPSYEKDYEKGSEEGTAAPHRAAVPETRSAETRAAAAARGPRGGEPDPGGEADTGTEPDDAAHDDAPAPVRPRQVWEADPAVTPAGLGETGEAFGLFTTAWQGLTGTELVGSALDEVRRAWDADPDGTATVAYHVAEHERVHPVAVLLAALAAMAAENGLRPVAPADVLAAIEKEEGAP